jgi:hypothetical protein
MLGSGSWGETPGMVGRLPGPAQSHIHASPPGPPGGPARPGWPGWPGWCPAAAHRRLVGRSCGPAHRGKVHIGSPGVAHSCDSKPLRLEIAHTLPGRHHARALLTVYGCGSHNQAATRRRSCAFHRPTAGRGRERGHTPPAARRPTRGGGGQRPPSAARCPSSRGPPPPSPLPPPPDSLAPGVRLPAPYPRLPLPVPPPAPGFPHPIPGSCSRSPRRRQASWPHLARPDPEKVDLRPVLVQVGLSTLPPRCHSGCHTAPRPLGTR